SGGCSFAGSAQPQYGGHPRCRHDAGETPAASAVCCWLSLPTLRESACRHSRSCSSQVQDCYLRTWMLLASASAMPFCDQSCNQRKILEGEVSGKHSS